MSRKIDSNFSKDEDNTIFILNQLNEKEILLASEVGATSVEQCMRKAAGFMQNLRGAKTYRVGAVEGTTRHVKNGKYIDLAHDGTIV